MVLTLSDVLPDISADINNMSSQPIVICCKPNLLQRLLPLGHFIILKLLHLVILYVNSILYSSRLDDNTIQEWCCHRDRHSITKWGEYEYKSSITIVSVIGTLIPHRTAKRTSVDKGDTAHEGLSIVFCSGTYAE